MALRRLAPPRAEPSEAEVKYATSKGTASYEHCLHRVKSMSDEALANRIKAIERARGRFCIAKMEIFESVLRDQGLTELADDARAALLRLQLPEK